MQVVSITHTPIKSKSAIRHWIEQRGFDYRCIKLYDNEALPSHLEDIDLLIVHGAPQSLQCPETCPNLDKEIAFVSTALKQNKAILGICFGAQLLAKILGATTIDSPYREIGIMPVFLTTEGKEDPVFSHYPDSFDVVHWHKEMFGLPKDAVLLAETPGCPHQAFRFGDRVYGIQYHLESTADTLSEVLNSWPDYHQNTQGPYIQTDHVLEYPHFDEINQRLFDLLDALTAKVRGSSPFSVEPK